MSLDSALNLMNGFDIKEHCHVNTNEDGDRFVGIMADADNAMVYFPLGYELPKTDREIRKDIMNLIRVLSEFTTKSERLLAVNRFSESIEVDFPINAYKNVIEYYFSIGGNYYIEKEHVYKTASTGKQDWARTVRKHVPLIQNKNGTNSFVFTKFEVYSSTPNDTKEITQINRFCVYEAFKRIGWLYVPYMPEEPGPHPDIKTSIRIIRNKLANTNDDKKKILFRGMKDMLEYMDERNSDRQFYYGTDNFEYVWERLIDRIFGIRAKEKYFPRSRWKLAYSNIEKRPLMPDTIMIHNDKYYILDAKYYKYGWTGNPDHLPDGSSIIKQITYGEYLENNNEISTNSIFNAFIMPYDMFKNPFDLDEVMGIIGQAVSDWRKNEVYYEKIQGVVVDIRHLMHHYSGNPMKERETLASCIDHIFENEEKTYVETPAATIEEPQYDDIKPSTLKVANDTESKYHE